jgi:hypothetical protein
VVDAQPKITLTVDKTHGNFPWENLISDGTAIRFAAILGTTLGNVMAIVAPRCQVTSLKPANVDGYDCWNVELSPCRVLEAGDDELFLAQL